VQSHDGSGEIRAIRAQPVPLDLALEDRSEGMAAFIEKRKPVNKNR
jgi:hypothetical protein